MSDWIHSLLLDVVSGVADAAVATPPGTDPASLPETVSDPASHAARIIQGAIRACPTSGVYARNDGQTGSIALTVRWPRKFGPQFHILCTCARRIEAAILRRNCRLQHTSRKDSAGLIKRMCKRALYQRRYRLASLRKETRIDVPAGVRRRFFVDESEMDIWDTATQATWKGMYMDVEGMYVQLRQACTDETKLVKQLKETREYEDQLYNDVHRGGGGGLVRTLGGMHKAKRVLEETQSRLQQLKEDCAKAKDTISRVSRGIEWAWMGGWESLGATELLVQEGHVQCAKDAYVALASRCVGIFFVRPCCGRVFCGARACVCVCVCVCV
jgi:hypothetical protein